MDDQPELRFTSDWTDEDRRDYLRELDEDTEQEVTPWEAEFIEKQLRRPKIGFSLSAKQRKVIENMYEKYRD